MSLFLDKFLLRKFQYLASMNTFCQIEVLCSESYSKKDSKDAKDLKKSLIKCVVPFGCGHIGTFQLSSSKRNLETQLSHAILMFFSSNFERCLKVAKNHP